MKNLYFHFSASRRLKNKSSDQIILKAWYFPQNDTSSFLFKKNCLRVIRIWEILEQDSQGCFLYYCYIIFTSYHGCVLLQVVGMVTRKDIGRYRMWSHRGQIGLEEVHILEANSIHDSFWLLDILACANVPGNSHCGAVQEKKNPPYTPYPQVNLSQVIFRHGTQLPADNLTTRVVDVLRGGWRCVLARSGYPLQQICVTWLAISGSSWDFRWREWARNNRHNKACMWNDSLSFSSSLGLEEHWGLTELESPL